MKKLLSLLPALTLIVIIFLTASGFSSLAPGSAPLAFSQDDFVIRRGVNISHWLSQSKRRGDERKVFFTKKDVALIARLGYDHIRMPVDEEQLWDESGKKDAEAFGLLHESIGWAKKKGLRMIIDLHILRSHHFNEGDKPLWKEAAAQETFFKCWRDLSAELKKYPNSFLAYELMNEPVADDPEDWNKLVAKALAVVRETEPGRYVVIGSNRWQSASTFNELRIPPNDRKIILSFHFYSPFPLTHYKTSWNWMKDYTGKVHYPGQLIDPADLEGLPAELAANLRRENRVYNRDVLEQMMELPLRKARETGLMLYCGEWGCYPAAPRPDLLQWYRDMRYVLERNNVAWANWDYKGGFGVVDGKTGKPIADLAEAMLGK